MAKYTNNFTTNFVSPKWWQHLLRQTPTFTRIIYIVAVAGTDSVHSVHTHIYLSFVHIGSYLRHCGQWWWMENGHIVIHHQIRVCCGAHGLLRVRWVHIQCGESITFMEVWLCSIVRLNHHGSRMNFLCGVHGLTGWQMRMPVACRSA